MNNIAIITARSGSKGLKDKNIKLLAGKPLLAYSIEAAKKSEVFNTIMVSTDSSVYADVSKKYGAEVPFLRSKETSQDDAGSWDVVREVLLNYLKLGKKFDTVCLLQPTSPLREAVDIVNGYNEMLEKDADSITAVCEMDHSPLWSMMLPDDLSLAEYKINSKDVPRQKLATYYRVNGALYIRSIEYRENSVFLKDDREYAYIMNRAKSIDIDTMDDFMMAEYYLSK